VLVDAQHFRAFWWMILTGLPLQTPQKVALHGRGSDALALAETAPIDAVEVLLKDHLLETLAGSLRRLDPRQLLSKRAAAIQTAAFANTQVQEDTPESPVVMPHDSPAPALVSKMRAPALGARYRPGIPGRYRDRATTSLNVANLKLGQAQYDL